MLKFSFSKIFFVTKLSTRCSTSRIGLGRYFYILFSKLFFGIKRNWLISNVYRFQNLSRSLNICDCFRLAVQVSDKKKGSSKKHGSDVELKRQICGAVAVVVIMHSCWALLWRSGRKMSGVGMPSPSLTTNLASGDDMWRGA